MKLDGIHSAFVSTWLFFGCYWLSYVTPSFSSQDITENLRSFFISFPRKRRNFIFPETESTFTLSEAIFPETKSTFTLSEAVSHALIHSSVQFSRSIMCDSLQLHGWQHNRSPCPSPTPGAYLNSCPSSQWCHPTISSSVVPFSFCLQFFPASGSSQMS